MDAGNPLVEVTKVFRKTLVVAGILAVVGAAAAAAVGYAVIGLGLAVGLGLGAVNAMGMRTMVSRSVSLERGKRQMAGSSVGRLAVVTGAVLLIFLASRDAGLGSLAGLALFQMMLLATSSKVILRQLKSEVGS